MTILSRDADRLARFGATVLLCFLAAWEVQRSGWLGGLGGGSYLAMLVLGAVGVWFGYRVVNYSVFADFLIAVEAEMNKVSRIPYLKLQITVVF